MESWHEANNRYLTAALTWLRLLLEQRAGPESAAVPITALALPGAPAAPPSRRFFRRPPAPAGSAAPALPPAITPLLPASAIPPIDERIAQAAAELDAAEAAADPPPALLLLGRRLGLSTFEREVLLLCAALELDTRFAALCARVLGDPARPSPTFALALALFEDASWDVLSPERPLRFWRLIEITQAGAQPLTTSPLRADERIVNYLKGLNYLDDRLAPLLLPLDPGDGGPDLPPSQQAVVATIIQHLQQAATVQQLPLVQLLGPDGAGKRLVARHVAHGLDLHLYRLPLDLLPAQPAELDTLARLWQRESLLLPLGLYLDAQAVERPAEGGQQGGGPLGPGAALARFLTRSDGLFFLATPDLWPGLDQNTLALDIAKPTKSEQQQAWADLLGADADDSPAQLAGQFNLNLATIRRVVQLVRLSPDPAPLADRLWAASLLATRPQLDVLAQRIDAKATWADLVLPPAEMETLRQVAAQVGQRGKVYDEWGFGRVMNRGLGISVLFAGESGTGKTMAAEVIANDLRLNLYRIDLSAVVSKYIGETEKNLRRLFDAAEDGGAILFFDEADALFGKRSEVKDSHDRYANIEINYLLQRMEAYQGLAILATNQKSALDPAFMRRLRFIVNFPFPGPAERARLWQQVFPLEARTAPLDYDRLARFNLTGGSIHNIALNAAFLAAQANTAVTMPLVLAATRTEMRKLERPINEADFRWLEPAEGVA